MWTSHASAQRTWNQLLAFARFLAALEQPPHDLEDLTPAVLKRWRQKNIGTSPGRNTLTVVRMLLRLDPRMQTGAAAEELARRIPATQSNVQSYEPAEFEAVRSVARRQFRAALLRIDENTQLLERWRTGELDVNCREGRLGAVLDHLARTGDVPAGAAMRSTASCSAGTAGPPPGGGCSCPGSSW
ncbi:hypothetical protein ACFQZC_08445 [Streptacidiphilus monticola]